jgi:hypothetical protein
MDALMQSTAPRPTGASLPYIGGRNLAVPQSPPNCAVHRSRIRSNEAQDLQPNAAVRGATAVSVQWDGADAFTLIFRDAAGLAAEEIMYPSVTHAYQRARSPSGGYLWNRGLDNCRPYNEARRPSSPLGHESPRLERPMRPLHECMASDHLGPHTCDYA